jgi:glyoxylase-like metal-dependent hydrolase (beta-lactamase superfamily II)
MELSTRPMVRAFYHEDTSTLTYLVWDPESRDALIIDPVLDYDVFASQTRTTSADEVLSALEQEQVNLRVIVETHAHADHLSSAQYLKEKTGAPIGIGQDITKVQSIFRSIFNFPETTPTDGSQFDLLLRPGEVQHFGTLAVLPLPTPGHTPACLSYLIGDAVFTGDALFMEDYGTGRADFPGGSAEALYHSVHEVLYSLPEATRVFVGHDYRPGDRALRFESTIGREKASNVQLSQATTEAEYISLRQRRDRTLKAPRLIYQSVQTNVYGGLLPEEEPNGGRFFKIPLNRSAPTNRAGAPLASSKEPNNS